MAIRCPACGREYDVTLFQFGRTIHCTCGTRVGLEKRLGPRVTSGDLRFIADVMLGALARWLRIMGFDTAYDPNISDEDLVRRSVAEGRHLLTRDRRIPEEWRVSGCLLLEADAVETQVREVVARFDLANRVRLFSRCTLCNSPLEPMPPEEARGRVPDRVAEGQPSFSRCPTCDKVYWEGTHAERMRQQLGEILLG